MSLPEFLSSTSLAHQLIVANPRSNVNNLPYSYGTSGFRGHASILPSVALRMGMFAALRSSLLNGAVVGVMVTASHNDSPDNGLKLIDPSGEMMETSQESRATDLANTDESELCEKLQQLIISQSLNLTKNPPRIFVGRDTRLSSPALSKLVIDGAKSLGGEVVDFGLLTTPMLHFAVNKANLGITDYDYFQILSQSFMQALQLKYNKNDTKSISSIKLPLLNVDCANGVGTISMKKFQPLLSNILSFNLINTNIDNTELLNNECGAEHVQKTKTLPINFSSDPNLFSRCASIDGDADRIVYFFINNSNEMRLLDGDKILVLYTAFIHKLLKSSNLSDKLTIGCVQTAYANGASVKYIREKLNIEPIFTPSGVKHLHHVAAKFDIGIYFESNGHGTLIFSENAKTIITNQINSNSDNEEISRSSQCLLSLISLINQCVGDAVSDLLLVEVSLHHLNWSLSDWDQIYKDLPSLTLKVKVADRTIITVTDAERKCVTPDGLQSAIDAAVSNCSSESLRANRRSFARPSGTEDVVRVYAEATSEAECAELAAAVCEAVKRFAGGI